MAGKKKNLSFEESIEALEELVNSLEEGDLSLEDSLEAFEQGIKLTKECQQQLSVAEQKVALLTGDGDDMQLVDINDEEAS